MSAQSSSTALQKVEPRFDFGTNWRRFLEGVDEQRIAAAQASLRDLVGDLTRASFLDVGSGSGLSSLAAIRLGASSVFSFDFDPECVACTKELKRRYAPEAAHWRIERGYSLDSESLRQLGRFQVVYSWGVLHHTGDLWRALHNVGTLVEPGGLLVLALYRDQGLESRFWLGVKRVYNRNRLSRAAMVGTFVPAFFARGVVSDLVRGRYPAQRFREYERHRGMSMFRDWVDWLGGMPFEVASPEKVATFYRRRGFELAQVRIAEGSVRNNEYVFRSMKLPHTADADAGLT